MDLFAIGYYALACGFVAVSAPKLNSGFHRLLFGLTFGIIVTTAMPFLRSYFGV